MSHFMRQILIKPAKSAFMPASELARPGGKKNQCSGGPDRIVNRPNKNKTVKIVITIIAATISDAAVRAMGCSTRSCPDLKTE
jgi:hypothetical protein